MSRMTSQRAFFRLFVASVVILVLSPAVAHAGGGPLFIDVKEFRFTPRDIAPSPGTDHNLSFTNSGARTHTVTLPVLNIDQSIAPGGSISLSSSYSAGRYTFFCKLHKKKKMRGTITEDLSVSAPGGTAELGEVLTLSWGTVLLGSAVDVQMKRPGTKGWTTILADRTEGSSTYKPAVGGNYSFRARTQLGYGPATGWAPVQRVTVTG